MRRTTLAAMAAVLVAVTAALAATFALVAAPRARGERAEPQPVAGVRPGAEQGPLHRPDPCHHARHAGLEGLRAGTLQRYGRPRDRQAYTYAKDGFEATAYQLSTDQFGTQLDPPAHWAPEYPGIDELPATYAVRPLVVISIVPQVAEGPEVRAPGLRHPRVRAAARPHPARLRRDGALGLVEEVDRRSREGQGAGRRPGLPGRQSRRAAVPAPGSGTSSSTATSRSTRTRPRRSRASAGSCTTASRKPRASTTSTPCPPTGLPRLDRLPEVQGRPRRLCALRRHLSGLDPRRAQISDSDAPLPKSDSSLHWDTELGYRVR